MRFIAGQIGIHCILIHTLDLGLFNAPGGTRFERAETEGPEKESESLALHTSLLQR